MEFSRMGQHTVRCLVSEDEICGMGYTMEEIMSNGAKTQEFMNRIFEMAEHKFEMKFEKGVKTVRADFLPDHSLCLTFSTYPADGLLEHLKDLVGDLMKGEVQEVLQEAKNQDVPASRPSKETMEYKNPDGSRIIVVLIFSGIDAAEAFAKQVKEPALPFTSLYKYEDSFYMIMDLTSSTEEEVDRLSMLTDEFTLNILPGNAARAFIEEHGKVILKKEAIENLRLL